MKAKWTSCFTRNGPYFTSWTVVFAWQQAEKSPTESVTLYLTPTTTAGLPIMHPSKSYTQTEKAP
eukprot:6420756-Pyramimonas_sp.AAC.1